MVFTTLGTMTFAAGGSPNVSFTVDKATAAVGDTITVTVSNKAMTVSSFTCGFKFDLTKLKCTSISGPDSTKPGFFFITNDEYGYPLTATATPTISESNASGTVGIAFAGTADVKYKAGVVLTATFEVKATGDAAFTLYENTGGTNQFMSDAIETKTVTIAKAPISSVTASVKKPEAGKALDFTGTVDSSAPYSIAKVEWFEGTDASGTPVTAPATAKAKQFYYARITLTAKPDETFAASLDNTYSGDYSVARNSDKELYLTKAYPETGSLPAASVGNPPTAKSLKYNGSDQELVNAGTTPDGTMQYSLDNISWSDAIPKGKDAKTYTVYYKAVGDSGHSDSTVANVQVTIGKKDISGVTIGTIANEPYTGSAITPTPKVTDGGTTLVKDKDYTVSCTNNTNAGTATLTIKGKGNYTGTTTANFTIDPATQTLTVPGSTNVAFNKTLDLNTICSSNAPGAKLKFALAYLASMPSGTSFDATTGKVTAGNKTGSFKVTVDSDAVTPNYKAAPQGTITVNIVATPAASVTAAPTAKTDLKYNGNDQALVSEGTANGGTMQYSLNNTDWSDVIPKGKDAGNYTVYYKVKGDSDHIDYTPASNTVSVSIAQKEVTVAPGTYKVSKEYDTTTTAGTGKGDLSVTGIVDSGVSVTATPVAYTSANVGGQSNVDVNLALSGTGSANYKLAASTISVPCSITPAKLTVTGATVAAKIYDGSTNATISAVTFAGMKVSDTLTFGTDYTASGVFNSANVNDANKVIVTVTLKDTTLAKNYRLESSTYNQAAAISQAPTPTAPTVLTGVKGNKLVSVALPAGWSWANPTQEMTTDGSQTFTANYTDPEGNYAPGTGISVHVNVKAKTDVSTNITFPNGSLVYNGHGQEYKKATISGITAGDTPNWTYTYAVDSSTTATLNSSGLPKTVGKYKVTAIYEDSANYGTATAILEITQATPTVTPKFDKITEKGQKLSVANLGIGSSSPAGGKIEWVNDAGTALPGDTDVEANKAYKWKYTPADTTNYAPVYGTIVVYPVSTGIVIYSPCYTIKASAGANGTISPAGWCSVVENGSQTFTFTPDKGYTVAKVLVDGKSVGAVKSYTFKNVTKDHTIEVIFMKSNGNPATGVFVMP